MSTPKFYEPGLHPNVSWADYVSIPALNMSLLEQINYSPAHLKHAIDAPPTRSHVFDIGSATHWALLEPERFKADVIQLPDDADGRSAMVKSIKRDAEAAGKVVLKRSGYTTDGGSRVMGYEDVIAMRDACRKKDIIRSILDAPGYAECTVVWRDPVTELLCKGRLDRFCDWQGQSLVVDLKTTKCAKPRVFAYDIRTYHYHIKAAWYLDGLYTLSPTERRWFWLVVEKRAPWECCVMEPSDEVCCGVCCGAGCGVCCGAGFVVGCGTLERGRKIYRRWLAEYAACAEAEKWPGYADGIEPIQLPDMVAEQTDNAWVQ